MCRPTDLCPLERTDAEAHSVLVGSTLPGTAGVGEVDTFIEVLCENVVAGHLRSLVPGQRSPGEIRQPGEDVAERVDERLGAVSVWEMYQAYRPAGAVD